MAPPFIALDLHEFKQALDEWYRRRRRDINAVHMHHTWRPNHAQYRGQETIVGMWRHHTTNNGWSDIAQHLTIAPDGIVWTGRHWDMAPASSGGHNGTSRSGPFMFEMIGDFDQGKDPFTDPQRNAALWVVALVQKRFGLPARSLKFHRDLNSPKTCPGNALDYEDILAGVEDRLGRELSAPRGPRFRAGSYDPVVAVRGWLMTEPSPQRESPDAEPAEEHGPGEIPEEGPAAARGAVTLTPEMLNGLRAHVINLFGGQFSTKGVLQTDAGDVARMFEEELPQAIDQLAPNERLPIVLYAHGGLVDEEAGLRIAANQVDWWKGNGAYPIHFVWESGLFETIARMLGAQRAAARDLAETFTDPVIETIVRAAGGEKIWSGMKFSAARAFEPDGAGSLVVEHLARLMESAGDRVSLHAIGHSAGSIFHAYLLPALLKDSAQAVATLSLLAPAITVEEYKRRLDPLVGNRIRQLAIFTMAKDFERADTVTFAYRKSLLYLINRALEPRANEPILGLEESIRADRDLSRRLGISAGRDAAEVIWSQTRESEGRRASRSTTHGGFDNDVATMESVLRRIRGLDDAAPLARRFPPDTESRSVPAPKPVPVPGLAAAAPPAEIATAIDQQAAPVTVPATAATGGGRRALCIGIDAYPDPQDRLSGCVADARAWAAALQGLGFTVERMFDQEARRDAILARLTAMIQNLVRDDRLGFREALVAAFGRREIFPSDVCDLSELSLLWNRPSTPLPKVAQLDMTHLHLGDDPGRSPPAEEIERQASLLADVVTDARYMREFGLVPNGTGRPVIESVRTIRRVGPDRQVRFGLVAEVVQRTRVSLDGGTADQLGGATIIVGGDGRIRFVIRKTADSIERARRSGAFHASPEGERQRDAAARGLTWQMVHQCRRCAAPIVE